MRITLVVFGLLVPALARADDAALEFGPTLSPATYGLEGEVTIPIAPQLRFGVLAQASIMFDGLADINGRRLLAGGGEVRYVGAGITHLDLGVAAGAASGMIVDPMFGDLRDTGGFAALRISYTREQAGGAVSLTISPMVLAGFRGHDATPSIMTSLRWELPI